MSPLAGSVAEPVPTTAPAAPGPSAPARRRATGALARAPMTLVSLAAMVVVGWWATQDAGYDVRVWAPGGIILAALLAIALFTVPNRWRSVPRSTALAAGLLAGYCAWSFLSTLWADDPGAAWTGAARTTIYLVVFVLFAGWRQRASTAGVLLGIWVAVITLLATIIAVRLAFAEDPRLLLRNGRLLEPAGYENATAALMLMGAFPALVVAAGRRTHWGLRGLAAGATVLLACVALLAVSRGSLLATPICLAALLLVFDERLRRVLTLVPIAAAVAVAGPRIIDVTDILGQYQPPAAAAEAHAAAAAILIGAVIVALVVGLAAALETRRPASPRTARRANRIGAVAAALLAVATLGFAVTHQPLERLDSAWTSFKGGYTDYSGTRLGSGLGSNRYDFYRVALGAFRDAPLAGKGVDNFSETYLREGRSDETPRYPHSLELRTLSETGIIGALLLFGALGAALPAALRAGRGRFAGSAGRTVATGALLATAYWVVHGSADWFFEYAGLGTAAFALLGLACSLDPARDRPLARAPRSSVRVAGRVWAAAATSVAAVFVLVLFGLWSSDREVRRAGQLFATRSGEAYERLDRARVLTPLSSRPDSVAGSIAVRLGDYPRALRHFRRARERSVDDQYITLFTGALESALGEQQAAAASLRRAVELAPRDQLARDAYSVVRSGDTLDPAAVSRRILTTAETKG